jgi:hypothetical protein
MAEGVSDLAKLERERSGDRGRHRGSPYSQKFLAVTATLVGIAIGAVAVAIVILLSPGTAAPGPPWSTWRPPDSGLAGEREIAAEVAPFYRASNAMQLAVVTVQNINNSTTATGTATNNSTELALRDPNTGSLAALAGTTAVYDLCGLGANCAISVGIPSYARLLLLRREALELSLYTFKYITGVDNVVAILPPGKTTQSCTGICAKPHTPTKTTPIDLAVFFDRQSLQRLISEPLRATLPEVLPPTVTEMPAAPEAELVSVLTGQALFKQQLIQAQDGTNVLVLDQVPPQ